MITLIIAFLIVFSIASVVEVRYSKCQNYMFWQRDLSLYFKIPFYGPIVLNIQSKPVNTRGGLIRWDESLTRNKWRRRVWMYISCYHYETYKDFFKIRILEHESAYKKFVKVINGLYWHHYNMKREDMLGVYNQKY